MLKFATSALAGLLSSAEGQVTLELTGQLTDGSDFTARDCVTVVPPHNIVAANVQVQSNIGGTLIETSPPDRNNDSGGFTNLGLAYTPNTQVAFTVPASRNGVAFRQWFVGGVPQPFGQRTVSVQVNSQTVVRAVYGPPIRFQAAPRQAADTD